MLYGESLGSLAGQVALGVQRASRLACRPRGEDDQGAVIGAQVGDVCRRLLGPLLVHHRRHVGHGHGGQSIRQLAEECLYVVEGRGYDIHVDYDVEITDTYHWTPQKEEKRYEWEAGDVIYIPPNTIHQHFNAAKDKPVRLISCTNRIYKACGLNDLEQIEDCPEYDAKVVLTGELIDQYLKGKTKEPA